MRNSILKRAASTAIAGLLAITSAPFLAKENDAKAANASVGQTLTLYGKGQETGTCDGYSYEIWQEDTPNTSSMTLGSGGSFTTKWQCGPNGSKGNFLARRGFNYGKNNPKHWQDYGNFTCDFDCEWSAGTAGNSRLCIYGWTQNPLVEYYIVEDWKNWVPSASNSGGTAKGTATIDGSTYDIFTCARDSYTIEGNKPFTQYFSVRKSPRSSGVISIYKHFEAWESLGMKMGGFYEVAFNVEGWESDGQANVKKNVISYGTDPVPTDPPKEPDGPGSDGKYFSSSFESGKDDWESRGNATVSLDTTAYYEGSQSLKISGRTDNWHGAAIALNSDQFVPGYSYSFDAAALQKSGKSATLQLTLQQGSGDSATYTQIAEATAKSGEWTALSNKSFTIPSGTGDLLLYIESPDSLTDIWLDNVTVAKDGTAGTVVTGKGTAGSTSEPTTDPQPQISDEIGLKNYFGKYFKFGTCVNETDVSTHADFILKHFNSITPENELKPENIFDQQASMANGNNVNPIPKLPSNARAILDFAVEHDLPVRGHTLIWHSQTPLSFYREGFTDNGAFVSKDIMNQRIQNWIKNVFEMLKKEYPTLKLYAYDVANECFDDQQNGLRHAGTDWQNSADSPWTMIYGDDSFLEVAFTAAKEYAPEGCKLFYNDYNEYYNPKHQNIVNLVTKLYNKGVLDGVGMQSHLGTSQPDITTYTNALNDFAKIGCEVQVTELDITCDNGASFSTQAECYKNIVNAIMNCDKVTSLTVWGTNDSRSWRRSQNPLLFDSSYKEKEAYTAITGLVNASDIVTNFEDPTDPTSDPASYIWGDANCNGEVTLNDAVAILQYVALPAKYPLSELGMIQADVDGKVGISGMDALSIQKYDAKLIKKLPEGDIPTVTTSGQKKTEPTVTTAASVTPETLHSASFNSGMDGWTSRGNTTLTTDSESYYSAGSSVKVSGRSDTWQGIAYDLSKIAKAGETYSFSAAVMQGSGADVDMMITLQYDDADGKESYSNIASETVKSKTWTKLENTSYTIPAGATNLLLYVEASSMTDFYLDDVLIASKGTKSDVTTGKGTVGEDVGKIKAVEGVDISWIDPSKPMVAISFDDGTMDPTNEKKIIDTVVKNGFHATFFYVSDWISSPDTVRYAYQNGMEIANHSKDHKKLSTLSSDQIKYEWQACNDALKNIIGTDPSKLLRLPELAYNTTVQQALSDVPLISCAIDTKDWAGANKDAILQTLNNALNDGSLKNAIVLAHENYPATAAAMEEFLPVLKAKGWQVVTISEMFAVNGKTLNGGQVYTRCQ